MADKADDLDTPKIPMRPAVQPNALRRAADLPPPNTPRSEPPKQPDSASADARQPTEPRTMIVGQGISISGDISSCNRLVVEGSLEAKLHDCRQLEIAEHGTFNGNASVEQCEVSGHFEGDLVVSKRLFIRAAGHVSGTITYGEIEIERGGKLSGTVRANKNNSVMPSFGVLPAGE